MARGRAIFRIRSTRHEGDDDNTTVEQRKQHTMITDTETRTTDGALVSAGIARLLDGLTTEYLTQDELTELRRAVLELEAYKRAFRAHGVAIDEAILFGNWLGTWVHVPAMAVYEQPPLPSPYQTLCLVISAMIGNLIAGRAPRAGKTGSDQTDEQ